MFVLPFSDNSRNSLNSELSENSQFSHRYNSELSENCHNSHNSVNCIKILFSELCELSENYHLPLCVAKPQHKIFTIIRILYHKIEEVSRNNYFLFYLYFTSKIFTGSMYHLWVRNFHALMYESVL